MVVHSALPRTLTEAVDEILRTAGVEHAAHGDDTPPVRAAEVAAGDPRAVALIGPFRSADVAEAVEATAPAGLPLLAPVATWAGVTRDDEPGCLDAARHRGTVLRMVRARHRGRRADRGGRPRVGPARARRRRPPRLRRQLDGQLRLHDLPRAGGPGDADVLVLCALAGAPEIERAAALAPLPIVMFDGVQGARLGAGRDVRLALPFAPGPDGRGSEDLFTVEPARRAARLVVGVVRASGRAADRVALLQAMRAAGPFDPHGDLVEPPVWLWRAREDWALVADRPLAPGGAA